MYLLLSITRITYRGPLHDLPLEDLHAAFRTTKRLPIGREQSLNANGLDPNFLAIYSDELVNGEDKLSPQIQIFETGEHGENVAFYVGKAINFSRLRGDPTAYFFKAMVPYEENLEFDFYVRERQVPATISRR